jgi:hypothetical protein
MCTFRYEMAVYNGCPEGIIITWTFPARLGQTGICLIKIK